MINSDIHSQVSSSTSRRGADNKIKTPRQIATLVSQGLISRVSCYKNLDTVKFKCGIPLELAMKISRLIEFDVSRFIMDIKGGGG